VKILKFVFFFLAANIGLLPFFLIYTAGGIVGSNLFGNIFIVVYCCRY
jgi:hypothetical protein